MYDESNSTASAVQVEANLQERLSDRLPLRQERLAETLAYGEIQRIAFVTPELALVTVEWALAAVAQLSSG